MEELIRIPKQNGKQLVSAKELYEKLGLNPTLLQNHWPTIVQNSHPTAWSRWCRTNITENPYATEGVDYESLDMMSREGPGNFAQDFALTIDFAKRLFMLVITESGERICRNFIKRRNSHGQNRIRKLIASRKTTFPGFLAAKRTGKRQFICLKIRIFQNAI